MVDSITIAGLPATASPSVDHLIPAMKDGVTVYLSGAQIVALAQAAIRDGAPEALDTLDKLAAAIGDDANYAASVAAAIAAKADQTALDAVAGDLADLAAIVNPAPDAILEHQLASGTSGGTPTATAWTKRPINTEVSDPGGIVSLASSEFTVTVDCYCEAFAQFYTSSITRLRLYNVTDAAVVNQSLTDYFIATYNVGGTSAVQGLLEAGKTYRVEYYVSAATTFGLGIPGSLGSVEIYARVHLRRT